jgi:hypothetical protein
MPTKRCPNGSRRNINGICIKKAFNEKSNTKRCPIGYRKNKSGVCVKYNTRTKKGVLLGDGNSPRSNFAKRYFANKKGSIQLLDKIGKSKRVIFQVNYNDVSHFTDYRNLSSNPRLDCVFKTISSMGVRRVKPIKQDSADVDRSEVLMFIKKAFALSGQEEVDYVYIDLRGEMIKLNKDKSELNEKIVDYFNSKLKNGYATMISVEITMRVGMSESRDIILYKYNNQLHFFNPQGRSELNPSKVFNSINIYDLFDQSTLFIGVGYYIVYNLKSPKKLINTSCSNKT